MCDTSLTSFKAITNFCQSLSDTFGDKFISLKLYCHLINKTTVSHEKAIAKHISIFRDFCVENRNAIKEKNDKNLVNTTLMYSNKAKINLKSIFDASDKETKEIIWSHLLIISALVDPAGKAKEILKKNTSGTEGEFLQEIITKMEKTVDPNAPPMESIANLMKSDVIPDLFNSINTKIQDGSLDMGKLMSSMHGIMTGINNEDMNNEGINNEDINNMKDDMLNNMNGLLGNMLNKQTTETNNQQLDMSSLLGPMMNVLTNLTNTSTGNSTTGNSTIGNTTQPNIFNMLNNLNLNSLSIEEQINRELENNKKHGKLNKIEDIE
jgi:hypothetical protein